MCSCSIQCLCFYRCKILLFTQALAHTHHAKLPSLLRFRNTRKYRQIFLVKETGKLRRFSHIHKRLPVCTIFQSDIPRATQDSTKSSGSLLVGSFINIVPFSHIKTFHAVIHIFPGCLPCLTLCHIFTLHPHPRT